MRRRRWPYAVVLVTAIVALVATVALAAAGDRRGMFMGSSDPDAPYDLRFIDEMTMHHQGAVMSAQMMIADSPRPQLRDLAGRITESQERQIDQMAAWRRQWYPNTGAPSTGMQSMGGMGRAMGGRGSGGMAGGQVDRMFLRMMIPHHQLAIEMAEDALENAEHQELKGLARQIIKDQSAEIEEMEGYLKDWYGEDSTRGTARSMRGTMPQMGGGMGR